MKRLRGIWASLIIAVGLAVIILSIYVLRSRGNNGKEARKMMRLWFPLGGYRLERIGEFDESADLLVINHQSYADIICVESYHPKNICWVAKKQLGDIPFYGRALKAPEMILIDRENKTGLATLLKRADIELKKRRVIAIFPEGTRGEGGRDLLPFRPGVKILAEKFKLKIQPILLLHTKRIYNDKLVTSTASLARMVALPAFSPDFGDKEWYIKLETIMREEYQRHYDEMARK